MEIHILVLSLLLIFSLIISGAAVHPGCECLLFSGSRGKDRGVFTSPDYPNPYEEGIDCILYTFVARRDQIVQLTFRDFDVQKSHLDCVRGDFVKLFLHLERPEVNEYTPWSNVLCGGIADVPHHHFSSGHGLVLEFHSDHKPGNNSGFMGTFRFLDRRMFQADGQKVPGTMCDYQFVSSNFSLSKGRFYSPRYPAGYPRNIKCAYRFRARLRERIRIVFEEVTLQKGDLSCINRADLIRVYDGRIPPMGPVYGGSSGRRAPSAKSSRVEETSAAAVLTPVNKGPPVISVLCNEGSEREVLSTGRDLTVEFVSDSESPGQGFKATFEFQPMPAAAVAASEEAVAAAAAPPPHGHVGPSGATNCNQVFSSDISKNGTLTSPDYPNPYPSRSQCRFDFQGRGKERIQVTFTDFNLYHPQDDSKDCETIDSLMAYVQIDGRMEKIDNFCASSIPLPLMSNGPRMVLEFRGLYSSRYARGFKAIYTFTENFGVTSGRQLPDYPCAFVFNSSETLNGTFSSPNYPGNYPRDTECHYFFHGKAKEKVHIHFTYFDVEGVLPCDESSASDYVEFSNFLARDRKYPRLCGQLREFDIESDRKFFRVTFRSNYRLDGKGFHATYQFLDDVDSFTVKPSPSAAPFSVYREVTSVGSIVKGILLVMVAFLCSGHPS
ncbi:suppressor of lurcher protein 1 [Hetaerina americana]|uniref:suppressor of lurcher protein 1 n=1 Tax=Hetaerina americana TaxID=62018 RepID=UPI003A7F43D3